MMMMMMMNYTLDLRQTFWRVANGRGSVFLWRRLDKLATSRRHSSHSTVCTVGYTVTQKKIATNILLCASF